MAMKIGLTEARIQVMILSFFVIQTHTRFMNHDHFKKSENYDNILIRRPEKKRSSSHI